MIDREYVNRYPEKGGWFKTFFKRMFCGHDYPMPKREDFPNGEGVYFKMCINRHQCAVVELSNYKEK